MKRLLAILFMMTLMVSCHQKIWDMLNDHEARIARLEAFCKQLNTNISSLEALVNAVNARDYVKDVVPIYEEGEVIGYTITFGKSNPVTIYNGKNGEDGHTPVIGIKSEDGIWYWTLDGEWILDSDGKRVRADGSSGIIPQLKIEDDYWWVSYDNGTSWSKLGAAATGTVNPQDSQIQITQDDKNVYITLPDGEVITIPKSNGLTWVYV